MAFLNANWREFLLSVTREFSEPNIGKCWAVTVDLSGPQPVQPVNPPTAIWTTLRGGYQFHVPTTQFSARLLPNTLLVAGEPVDALSMILHGDYADERGKPLIERLRKLIPRQMFEVALQAAIGTKIIARETISAMRKERACKVLRRRYHPKTQADRKAERREAPHEARWASGNPARGVSGRAQGRQRVQRVVYLAGIKSNLPEPSS
jgi:hypothetical protein